MILRPMEDISPNNYMKQFRRGCGFWHLVPETGELKEKKKKERKTDTLANKLVVKIL